MSPGQEPNALASRAQAIVARALELDVDEGAAHVDAACGDEQELKDEVLALMDAEAISRFHEIGGVPASGENERLANLADRDGQMIGSFRVIRTIGSGGMGIVYEAEQDFPRRRVALKVLPPSFGRDGAEVRFRSEVQLLARIDHPGVARMLEAGVHVGERGEEQPFFAMEFVPDARDLTSWGQEHGLRERLSLFVEVCDAVQHGHQQGVVHRDLKPANVLVTVGNAPKVIDFGVAGAVEDEEEAARTRATQAGDVVGTLQYMAPEQLEGSLQVDTRTDIYALGLLLYELVTGEPPYELSGRSLSEIVTVIRDEAPARVLKPDRVIPQDLRWVILRATDKEPDRRYSSASELAADLNRFLDFRPVEAARPSRLYAFRKFVARNKVASAATAIVLVSIAAGTVISVTSMLRASREADNFRSMNAVLTGMFEDVRAERGGANIPAVDLLDRAAARVASFADRPELEADVRLTLLKSYANLGHYDRAIREGERALALAEYSSDDEEAEAARYVAHALLATERLDESREVLRRFDGAWFTARPAVPAGKRAALLRVGAALDLREGRPEDAAEQLLGLLNAPEASDYSLIVREDIESTLFSALVRAGRLVDAEARARDRAERLEEETGPDDARGLAAKAQLAQALLRQRKYGDAEPILESILEPSIASYGQEHSFTLVVLNGLAAAYIETGKENRAISYLEEVVRVREARDGAEHPETLIAQLSLADVRNKIGDERGEELLREGLAARKRLYGPRDRRTLQQLRVLCGFLRRAKRLDEAEPFQVELYEASQEVFADEDLELHTAAAEMGLLRLLQGRPAEASPLLESAWRGYLRRAEPGDSQLMTVGNNLAGALFEEGRIGEAIDVFIEILSRMREDLEPSDKSICSMLMNLSAVREQNGEFQLALARRREALDWCIEHRGEDDPFRLRITEALGELLVTMERPREALEYYREVSRAARVNPKLTPQLRNAFQLGLARCLTAAGERREAVDAFQAAIEMERARLGDVDPSWIEGLEAELADAKRLLEDAAETEVD